MTNPRVETSRRHKPQGSQPSVFPVLTRINGKLVSGKACAVKSNMLIHPLWWPLQKWASSWKELFFKLSCFSVSPLMLCCTSFISEHVSWHLCVVNSFRRHYLIVCVRACDRTTNTSPLNAAVLLAALNTSWPQGIKRTILSQWINQSCMKNTSIY